MTDPLEQAFDTFADAAEATLLRMSEEVRTLRAEVENLRAELRAAPTSESFQEVATREGPAGKDGRGIIELSIRDGDLWSRYSDGTEAKIGRVVGERGETGERGADGGEGPAGRDGAASTVPGPDGLPGGRGADGAASIEEVREIVETSVREAIALVQRTSYQGVYRAGETYKVSQTVTWDGSTWNCNRDTSSKPGIDGDWTLMVKHGRDGRDRT